MDIDGLETTADFHRTKREESFCARRDRGVATVAGNSERPTVRISRRCSTRRTSHTRSVSTSLAGSGDRPATWASSIKAAIDRVRDEVWPEPRNADELHDALVELGFLTEQEGANWQEFFDELKSGATCSGVTSQQNHSAPVLWVAAERLPQLNVVYPRRQT